MNKLTLFGCVAAVCLGTLDARAQSDDSIEQIRNQLREVEENFLNAQEEHQRQIDLLNRKIAELERKQAEAPPPVTPAPVPPPPQETWSPANPIRVQKGNGYADLGMVATFAAGGSTADDIEGGTQLGGHDPNQNGFTVQGVELNLQGAVDPYFRGNANIAFQIDSGGESFVELEEAWIESVSLSYNLQVRGGQLLTDFGRINTQHPHTWAFVDEPLVNGRFLGEDGLRNPGVRLSWLAPTPFYSELMFGVQDSQGGTAAAFRDDHGGDAYLGRLNDSGSVHGVGDMLFSTHYSASFDVTDNQTLLAGASAAFGPNGSGRDTNTQIYGADLFWKWKSPHANGGFPFVSWQTEAMLRRYEAGAFSEDLDGSGLLDSGEPDLNEDGIADAVPAETLVDFGFYSQVAWGFRKGWVAALRGGYVAPDGTGKYEAVYGRDPDRATRWRVSPNLTWYPSEFSKIRLQYNYDDRDLIGTDHSVWLQFEFLLGAHAAHKF